MKLVSCSVCNTPFPPKKTSVREGKRFCGGCKGKVTAEQAKKALEKIHGRQ